MSITYSTVKGTDMERLIAKLEAAVSGERRDLIMMACLAMALLMQDSSLDLSKIAAGVKGASEWMACYVAEPKGKSN